MEQPCSGTADENACRVTLHAGACPAAAPSTQGWREAAPPGCRRLARAQESPLGFSREPPSSFCQDQVSASMHAYLSFLTHTEVALSSLPSLGNLVCLGTSQIFTWRRDTGKERTCMFSRKTGLSAEILGSAGFKDWGEGENAHLPHITAQSTTPNSISEQNTSATREFQQERN